MNKNLKDTSKAIALSMVKLYENVRNYPYGS